MRLLFFILLLLFGPAAYAAEETRTVPDPLAGAPAPLAEAIRQFGRDADRWAYTQHMVIFDRKGRARDEQLARYDPSQPPDAQWTLLQVDGKPATAAQVGKHRRDKAKSGGKKQTLGELLEFPQAVLAADSTPAELIYDVPLRRAENFRFPPEKFQVRVTVDRAAQTLRAIDVKLRSSLRLVGVVKVKSAIVRLVFTPVLPEYGPALTELSAEGSGSLLLVPVASRTEARRTDFNRVTPYNERLKVKLGPLQLLDF
jgi:hypothetical protein